MQGFADGGSGPGHDTNSVVSLRQSTALRASATPQSCLSVRAGAPLLGRLTTGPTGGFFVRGAGAGGFCSVLRAAMRSYEKQQIEPKQLSDTKHTHSGCRTNTC